MAEAEETAKALGEADAKRADALIEADEMRAEALTKADTKRAEAILDEAHEVRAGQMRLTKVENKNRRNGRWLALGLALDVALSLFSLNLYLGLRHAHTARVVACREAEKVKATDAKLWAFILNVPPRTGQSPTDPDTLAQFRVLLKGYDPSKC